MISRARPATWAFRAPPAPVAASRATRSRALRTTPQPWKDHHDPRLKEVGREILDDYAQVRDHYESPKNALVLAHGLLGFSEIRAPLQFLPAIHYWHGITDALQTLAPSLPIITPSVPPTGSIEQRAEALAAAIEAGAPRGRPVNIIAHSMGGLDARYMISRLRPAGLRVASLVTISTPHHGSAFADFMLHAARLSDWYGVMGTVGLGTGAFDQLTTAYLRDDFNPATPDDPDTRYFSFGAATDLPGLLSPFRHSWRVVTRDEGPNDGLVSVRSSRWGDYRGTLRDVSHLDLINWTNRLRWETRRIWTGQRRPFNAVALYLDIADMLAKEGL
ncbi:hypothetical protein D7B24_007754 [Verticillium nonalfalfae]|uniref:Thioesterase domain-containing protein n=1 Tax=Verticillium nonalfalfae TaxID=1051616 RepID=A0A3M9Y8J5_9PEZI|nr:uncharacterized protein D7B24_007754 [Verticillium nonalfalfae]RNJ56086.1 hypothetical protein D7B24_007754 [Verticillium nonalfalfae]